MINAEGGRSEPTMGKTDIVMCAIPCWMRRIPGAAPFTTTPLPPAPIGGGYDAFSPWRGQ
jgi:hypothetical protein